MKNILFDLVNEPIIIKDYSHKIENNREVLFHEEEDKIIGRHGMVINQYEMSKEKVKKLQDEQIKTERFILKNQPKVEAKTDKSNTKEFFQPKMRYKPRTDLERIINTINNISYNKKNQRFIKDHIKVLNNKNQEYVEKRIKSYNNRNQEDDPLNQDIPNPNSPKQDKRFETEVGNSPQTNSKTLPNKKNKEDKKINFRFSYSITKVNDELNKQLYKKQLNSDAKQLINEFQLKTYFKGIETLAMKKLDKPIKPSWGLANSIDGSEDNSALIRQVIKNKKNRHLKELSMSLTENTNNVFHLNELNWNSNNNMVYNNKDNLRSLDQEQIDKIISKEQENYMYDDLKTEIPKEKLDYFNPYIDRDKSRINLSNRAFKNLKELIKLKSLKHDTNPEDDIIPDGCIPNIPKIENQDTNNEVKPNFERSDNNDNKYIGMLYL